MLTFLKRRGIALITTLILVLLLSMMLGAALTLLPNRQAANRGLYEMRAAGLAAESGLQYALARLQARPSWRGDWDGVGPSGTVTSPDGRLVVTEDRGNVIGYINTGDGQMNGQFRLRFNYYDGPVGGAGDADQLDDPAYKMPLAYVSVNNLAGGSAMPVPRAVDSGGGLWQVTAGSPMPYDAPKFTVCLIVEGRAGMALRDQLAGGTPNPDPPAGNRNLSRTVQEAYFQRQSVAGLDSVASAGSNIDFQVMDKVKVSSAAAQAPRVRSNGNVAVNSLPTGSASYVTDTGGDVYVANTGSFTIDGAASTSPAATTQTTPAQKFLQLKWSQVNKAAAGDANVGAGTYIWRGLGAGAYLEYYPSDYDPAAVYAPGSGMAISTGAALELTSTGALTVTPASHEVSFGDNVWVRPVGTATGLAIVPDPALTLAGVRPKNTFVKDPATGDVPILTSNGDLTFKGELAGQGSISSYGNITFQGTSALETTPDQMVAVYAKGDINLEAIPDEVVTAGGGTTGSTSGCSGSCTSGSSSGCSGTCTTGSGSSSSSTSSSSSSSSSSTTGGAPFGPLRFQDQVLTGVIYTQRNFNVNLSGLTYRGNLLVRGVLAAYGGDPDLGEAPNANGQGLISVQADNAELIYDPSFVAGILNFSGPTPLERTFSSSY